MDEGGSTGGCDSARSTATRWRSCDRRGAARSRQAVSIGVNSPRNKDAGLIALVQAVAKGYRRSGACSTPQITCLRAPRKISFPCYSGFVSSCSSRKM
jgi:hypothetical protein